MRLQSNPTLESIKNTGDTVYNIPTKRLTLLLFQIESAIRTAKNKVIKEKSTAGILSTVAEIPQKCTNGAHKYAYNALCPPLKLIR